MMLSRCSVFFLIATATAFLVGASSNVDASKQSQVVSSELQRRAETLDEGIQNDMLDEDHLDEDHLDEDHLDEDGHDEDDHDEDDHDEDDHDEDDHDEDDHDEDDHDEDDHDEDHLDEDGNHIDKDQLEEFLVYNSEDKPWGEVILAALLINLASLIGVVFLVGSVASKKFAKPKVAGEEEPYKWNFTQNIIPSFACGALLATSLFLILPESFNLISAYAEEQAGKDEHDSHRMLEDHDDGDEDHVDTDVPVAWKFGVSVIGGFLLPIVTSMIFPHGHDPELCDNCEEAEASKLAELELSKKLTEHSAPNGSKVLADANVSDESELSESGPVATDTGCEDTGCDCNDEEQAGAQTQKTVEGEKAPQQPVTHINYSLASSVLLGDFFHNFTDGIFIGTAFTLCDRELAIAVSAATVYHELAQEVADYFLLTKHCNIRPAAALTLNFVSGLSVLFGAVLILSANVNTNTMGCLLAIGAGVYLYIAAAECLPRARSVQKNTKDKLVSLFSFVFGVIPIGLVLLNHGHCEASH